MSASAAKNVTAYQCDVCNRQTRIPYNPYGIDVLQMCNITKNCRGKLFKINNPLVANAVPTFPPSVDGAEDWFQRSVLYKHTQTIKSNNWIIKHNLGNKPTVRVYANIAASDTDADIFAVVEPLSVDVIDLDTVSLTFARPINGVADCVSLASRNYSNPAAASTKATIAPSTQISTDVGEITIATLNSSDLVNVSLVYKTGTSSDLIVDYVGVSNSPSINSPWVGTNTIVVAGKRYYVRSFNITTTPLAPAYFSVGAIASGSTFSITAINNIAVSQNDCIILLANSPYASVDKITDKFVDVFSINKLTIPPLSYTDGKAYIETASIKSTYPPIVSVG